MFGSKFWIIHKPSTDKTYIVKSYFAPANDYLTFQTIGTLTLAGPFYDRNDAEKKLDRIKEELRNGQI
jgi:hypothetical protein